MRPILFVALLLAPSIMEAQRRHCEAARTPDPPPMAMQLVDSAALAAALPKQPVPPTTFSIWYDSTGRLTHALALSDSLVVRREASPDGGTVARAELATLIAGASFPQDSAEMHVRLTIARDSGGGVSLTVARSTVCTATGHPAFRAPNERMQVTREEIDDLQHAVPAVVSFVVDTTGHPLELLVTRSSGSRIIDDRVVNGIMSTPLDPATVDGFPKRVTMTLQILPPTLRP